MHSTISRPSGRFVLRIDPGLHASLREAAAEAGLSLNEYCARKLSSPGADLMGPAADAVARCIDLTRDALVGVVAYGSWSRDQLSGSSDVDLLIVVDASVSIARDLYRHWDENPLRWHGHVVEPHFVHLPAEEGRISGLWAEAALDGIVLFDRGFVLARRLVGLRRRIVEGRVERRLSHGHPYWVEGR